VGAATWCRALTKGDPVKGLKKVFWGSRRRRVAAVVAAFALTASTASAVTLFLLYSGVGGSGGNGFAGAQTVDAITLSIANAPQLGPGDTSPVLQITAQNDDPQNPHGIVSLTESFSSSPSQCAAFLTLNGKDSIIQAINDGVGSATVLPAGGSRQLWIDGNPPSSATITLGAGAPGSCANGTWTVSFDGVTS
jgi:hypothetical protein